MKKTENSGITLIALVITIIILLILAGITINSITGKDGIISKAQQAEKMKISQYIEKVELIRNELLIENKGKRPTIYQIKGELDDSKNSDWVASTEIKTVDNGIEKLVLTTKGGYIFYITETETEYRSEGINIDDLSRDDVIELKEVGTWTEGKIVQITNLSTVDYYELEYQIDSIEGEWTKIESGDTVDVKYGSIINARLVYVTNTGQIHRLKVGESEPTVVAKSTDTSEVVRKTDIALADLFDITWGSDGTGKREYTVTGNLNFNNIEYTSNEIVNISSLEIGTYKVTCKVTSPTNKTATAQKEVKVTELANTIVVDNNDTEKEARAIYSEYDLAYFRDLVNGVENTINGKLMNDIDLSEVCSNSVGSWTAIGEVKTFDSSGTWKTWVSYEGIFDGNNSTITNLYISSTNGGASLFGCVINDGTVKNLTVDGNIEINSSSKSYCVGGIVGYYWRVDGKSIDTNFKNLHNKVKIVAKNTYQVGGIFGCVEDTKVENCSNVGSIEGGARVGGIAGRLYEYAEISNSFNDAEIHAEISIPDANSTPSSFVRWNCRRNIW